MLILFTSQALFDRLTLPASWVCILSLSKDAGCGQADKRIELTMNKKGVREARTPFGFRIEGD